MSKQFPSELASKSASLSEREFDRFQCALCLKHKRATQVDHHGADRHAVWRAANRGQAA